MDVNTVIQFINGVGFPIVACVGMAWFFVWNKKYYRESQKGEQEKQDNLLIELKTSVDNNTKMIEKLIERLGSN